MGQVNVNTPGGSDSDSSGAGFILGIIVAIIVIAALVYFLVLAPGNNGADNGDGTTPQPSGWMLTNRAA